MAGLCARTPLRLSGTCSAGSSLEASHALPATGPRPPAPPRRLRHPLGHPFPCETSQHPLRRVRFAIYLHLIGFAPLEPFLIPLRPGIDSDRNCYESFIGRVSSQVHRRACPRSPTQRHGMPRHRTPPTTYLDIPEVSSPQFSILYAPITDQLMSRFSTRLQHCTALVEMQQGSDSR